MSFIQIIECRTSQIDELLALDREWHEATEGKRTARRAVVTRDRHDPDRHLIIAFFDSYESAMENSNLPETQKFASRIPEFTDGPMTFYDLDVIEDR